MTSIKSRKGQTYGKTAEYPKNESRPEANQPYLKLTSSTPLYCFSALQKEKGSPLALSRFEGPERSEPDPVRIDRQRYVEMPFTFMLRPFADVLASEENNIVRIEPLMRDGRELVNVHMNFLEKSLAGGKPKSVSRQCSILLDPGADWIIREIEYLTTMVKIVTHIDYREDEHKNLAPLMWTKNRFRLADGSPDGNETQTYTEFTFGPTPLSEFTLKAAGLPELETPGVKSVRSRTPYVLIGIGLLGLALVVFLKVLASRRPKVAS